MQNNLSSQQVAGWLGDLLVFEQVTSLQLARVDIAPLSVTQLHDHSRNVRQLMNRVSQYVDLIEKLNHLKTQSPSDQKALQRPMSIVEEISLHLQAIMNGIDAGLVAHESAREPAALSSH